MKLASYVILTSLVFSTFATAQEKKQKAEAKLPDMVKRSLERVLAGETTQRRRQMQTIVAFIADSCDLDEEQSKQLELAFKEAVEQSMRTSRKQLTVSFLNRRAGSFGNGEVVHFGAAAVMQEEIWKQGMERILNEKQKKLWKKEKEKRTSFQRTAMIQAALSMVDTQVLFSSKQRESLEKRLEAEFAGFTPGLGQRIVAVRRASVYVFPLLARYPEADLKEILAPSQIAAWKEYLARYAELPVPAREPSKK